MSPSPASRRLKPLARAALAVMSICALPVPASGQAVEVAPLAGYRFNNDLFEAAANRPVDVDGAPIVGGALNVALGNGLSFETLFTRQEADVTAPRSVPAAPARSRVVVDQVLAGGRQEFGVRGARPFFTGLLGLTRYGVEGDDAEVRFTMGAGGGVRVPVQRRIGVRLDSRVFTTFVDLDARAAACGPGLCLVAVDANVVWQFEFTADVIVVF
jgi:hypothetical protein